VEDEVAEEEEEEEEKEEGWRKRGSQPASVVQADTILMRHELHGGEHLFGKTRKCE
jgi:hypothetical protein